ncbi:hypothetical protein [Paenibacillus dendritiformis]|uniref:hypothetical protein n=1 Tax=Paenibacillus dendritiformis TaxID=130049 RepID=UPI00387E1FD6
MNNLPSGQGTCMYEVSYEQYPNESGNAWDPYYHSPLRSEIGKLAVLYMQFQPDFWLMVFEYMKEAVL